MTPILNISDIPLTDHGHGDGFAAKLGQFGPLIGMKQLGFRLVVVHSLARRPGPIMRIM